MKAALALILILFILLPGIASSDSWYGYVKTTNDTRSIYKQSENISFTSEQNIEGKIEALRGPRGRILSPYCSYFRDVDLDDVRIKDRTAAWEGNYSSSEMIKARAEVNPPIGLDISKPSGSDIYKVDFYENWPVNISSYKTLEYSGKGINDRDFAGNNLDFAGTNLLYNTKLSKDLIIDLSLERMNVTVLATDDNIILAERKATRDLSFRLSAHTTGIADITFQQSGPKFDKFSPTNYEILGKGEERYHGAFNLTENIHMKSEFDNLKPDDDWLTCCYEGWTNMSALDKSPHSADGIFDCTCSNPGGERQ
jgi:hypothetical protein